MRRLLPIGVAVATALAVAVPVLQAAPAQADAPTTTVVLTFDGTLKTGVIDAAPALAAHGMHGTFYVNSRVVGSDDGHLAWTDLTALEAGGHEVGGHALDMVDLTTIPVDQMHAQVCQDRATLVGHGLKINDFAYPSGMGYETPRVHDTVIACGYDSARRAWGLYSPSPDCVGPNHFCFDPAGPIPPTDPFAIPTPDIVQRTTTLADLEAIVTRAENFGGGLVPIIFQEICDGCDTYSTTAATLTSFLDFLQADTNVVVKTMHDALGEGAPQPLDTTAPASTIACNGAACAAGWYAGSVQVSLAAIDAKSGVAAIYYTTDGSTPSKSNGTVYSVPFPVSTTTTVKYRAYDVAGNAEGVKTQAIKSDSVAPATTVACNAAACSTGWYGGSVQVSLAATDTGGSGLDEVHYTTNGSTPTAASPTYSTAFLVASTTTVKFRAYDLAGNAEAPHSQLVRIDTTPPSTNIACNAAACSSGWYHGPVQVSLSASDGGSSGVSAIHYTTDGSPPTLASPTYTSPFSVVSTETVDFRAYDVVGNAEAPQSQVVDIDMVAPTSGMSCNSKACAVGWYRGSVKVALTGADSSSGVAAIHYTTDGSTPTAASPVYTAPFMLGASRNVKTIVIDNAGNKSAVRTTGVHIDKTRPAIKFVAPKYHALVTGRVHVTVAAADKQSGIAKVLFYVDGKLVATDTRAAYGFSWNTAKLAKKVHKVSAKAIDKAGNVSGMVSTTFIVH